MNDETLVRENKLRDALLARIARLYATRTQWVELGGKRFRFERIADPDDVLDQVAREEDLRERLMGAGGKANGGEPLHLPYWAELWESAQGVAGVLIEEGEGAIGGQNVLDLGCGMGLSGTVAAALGGRVTFADVEAAALLFARLNSLPWRERVRTRRLDWRRDALGERFDLIIGSDILYEKSQWEFLEPFWRGHLAGGGRVLLGEPGRQTGEAFVGWIKERGWGFEVREVVVAGRARAIKVMTLREGRG